MSSINDLPNELLDEIFSYLHRRFPFPKGRLVNSVCRRWNRPYMTTHVKNWKNVRSFNLQLTFPRLVAMNVRLAKLANFQGHSSLRKLELHCDRVSSYSLILSTCPRLTQLTLETCLSDFFDDDNIESLMTLCQCLTHLELKVELDENMNGKTNRILNARRRDNQGLLKLKNLTITVFDDVDYDDKYNRDCIPPKFDLVRFCSLFQAPFLNHLRVISKFFVSVSQQSKIISFFPRVQSIELERFRVSDPTGTIHGIYAHVTDLKFSGGSGDLQLILNQFPNLISLDTGISRNNFDALQPTKIHTLRIMYYNADPTLQMFPWLRQLELMVTFQNGNRLICELGLNCPQLVSLSLFTEYFGTLNPVFGNTAFPLLRYLKFDGDILFNESLTEFIARHPKLESLEYHSRGKYQHEMTLTISETILWPNLANLNLSQMGPEATIPRLHWFLKNSPNLVHLTFDMDGFDPTGNEGEIAFYCPNLKFLVYTGNVAGKSLTSWMRVENWAKSVTKMTLNIKIEPVDMYLLFKFLGTLSRLTFLDVTLEQARHKIHESKDVTYKNHLDQCPDEWKSIVMKYCDLLVRDSNRGNDTSFKSVLRMVVPNSRAKISAIVEIK